MFPPASSCFPPTGGEPTATVDETLAGSSATLVYDGSGMASIREFTVSDLIEDALYAFKVHVYVLRPT